MNQLIGSYFRAIDKVSESMQQRKPEDMRKLIIHIFEDIFSSLFESTEYASNYNNLINIMIDLNKSYNRFFENNSFIKTSQPLSSEEKDLLFQNLYEIKKLSLEIKNKLNENKNDAN